MVYDISIVAEHDYESDETFLDQIMELAKKEGWDISIISKPVPPLQGPIDLEGED